MLSLISVLELETKIPKDVCKIIELYLEYPSNKIKFELLSRDFTEYIPQYSDYGEYFAELISIAKPKRALRKSTMNKKWPRLNHHIFEVLEYDANTDIFYYKLECYKNLEHKADCDGKESGFYNFSNKNLKISS